MSQFIDNAARIFETAESTLVSAREFSDTTILISPTGGIRIVAGSDWPLRSLKEHHGAQMAYRVSRQETSVRVQGWAGGRTCLFETEKPQGAARRLLGPEQRLYTVQPQPLALAAAL